MPHSESSNEVVGRCYRVPILQKGDRGAKGTTEAICFGPKKRQLAIGDQPGAKRRAIANPQLALENGAVEAALARSPETPLPIEDGSAAKSDHSSNSSKKSKGSSSSHSSDSVSSSSSSQKKKKSKKKKSSKKSKKHKKEKKHKSKKSKKDKKEKKEKQEEPEITCSAESIKRAVEAELAAKKELEKAQKSDQALAKAAIKKLKFPLEELKKSVGNCQVPEERKATVDAAIQAGQKALDTAALVGMDPTTARMADANVKSITDVSAMAHNLTKMAQLVIQLSNLINLRGGTA